MLANGLKPLRPGCAQTVSGRALFLSHRCPVIMRHGIFRQPVQNLPLKPSYPCAVAIQEERLANAIQEGYSPDGLDIVKLDPQLAQYQDHLKYRYKQFLDMKLKIESVEGSLAKFAQGYQRMGFTREEKAIVYREWAPFAASLELIGDFSSWQGVPMQRDEWGVWTVKLPDGPDGAAAIAHNSRVKVRIRHHHGWHVDRVPAWITYARAEPGVMGAKYDGIYWNPPEDVKYEWRHEQPQRPASLRIYEAHVGMSGEDPKLATYADFTKNVLPRIKAAGYTAVQLMAVQEHAYYASFGYHVTNPFAISSRCGTPEDVKALVDEAHRLGLVVLLDVVHSHISKNVDDGLAGFDMGQPEDDNYFLLGEAGYQRQWDSRLFNYRHWEVLRYLLSNLRWWLEEYRFDGFRFDGVTSMLYQHHGINMSFSGSYNEYFGVSTNVDAVVYLMLANDLIHTVKPDAITIAEDVSGMPALARPVKEGGTGFDYRLGMSIPDLWIKLLKHVIDENWSMMQIVCALCNRRYTEKTVGYSESHDQALVGDKTIAFRLMDAEMYDGMTSLKPATPVIARGIALHKVIRAVTFTIGGEGYLNFMGNEFGHPEWIDFPREGNGWSHWHARRQWSLADKPDLRYMHLGAWDAALMALDDRYQFLSSPVQWVTHIDEANQVIVAERGPLLWVFNFSPTKDLDGYKTACPRPGRWRCVLSSDDPAYGGDARVCQSTDHFTQPERFNDRDCVLFVRSPPRTAMAYMNMDEEEATQQQSGASAEPELAAAPAAEEEILSISPEAEYAVLE